MYLCQYARNGDTATEPANYLPRHWEINIRFSRAGPPKRLSKGTVFHIIGATGCRWQFRRKDDQWYSETKAWAGSRFLGTIEPSQIDKLETVLAAVPLQHGHPTWNCHNWIWEALIMMRQAGFSVQLPVNLAALEVEMKVAKDVVYQNGDDSN